MTGVMNVQCALWLSIAAGVLAGCSRGDGSSSSPPPPIAGQSYSQYMPMQPGDRYECDSGLVLRIESATETNLGTNSAVRIVIEDGSDEFGFYWSEVPGLGTLHHGTFDLTSGRQVVLPTPEPIFRGPASWSNSAVALEFDAIGGATAARRGAVVLSSDGPSSRDARPLWYSQESIYGTIYQHKLLLTRWRFVHRGVNGSYLGELQLWSNPGYGPIQIVVGDESHSVVRAVLDGTVFD
jgi:hypothetical protein